MHAAVDSRCNENVHEMRTSKLRPWPGCNGGHRLDAKSSTHTPRRRQGHKLSTSCCRSRQSTSTGTKGPNQWLTSRGAAVTTSIFTTYCQDSERGILRCWHQGQLRLQWHESNYNSGYSSRKISTQGGTDHDDFLSGEVKTFHSSSNFPTHHIFFPPRLQVV